MLINNKIKRETWYSNPCRFVQRLQIPTCIGLGCLPMLRFYSVCKRSSGTFSRCFQWMMKKRDKNIHFDQKQTRKSWLWTRSVETPEISRYFRITEWPAETLHKLFGNMHVIKAFWLVPYLLNVAALQRGEGPDKLRRLCNCSACLLKWLFYQRRGLFPGVGKLFAPWCPLAAQWKR